MHSVHDVTAYMVSVLPRTSTMKVHKLLYYAQAWHLVWAEAPLFKNDIEAWVLGPVVRDVWDRHGPGVPFLDEWPHGDATVLSAYERSVVDEIVRAYGSKSAAELSRLSHSEPPWQNARAGLSPTQRSSRVISLIDMYDYFSQFTQADA